MHMALHSFGDSLYADPVYAHMPYHGLESLSKKMACIPNEKDGYI